MLDRAILMNRSMPLSREELAAFGRNEKKASPTSPTIMPYFSLKEIKVDGKMRLVPFVGIQGTF